MTDIDTPFMKKVFDIAKRKLKPDIHSPARRMISGEVLKYRKGSFRYTRRLVDKNRHLTVFF
tara:strand:- start:85 stop:270 length:186 start_codon:yes stop_codon:yes gene_type:complete